jgi:hypothetical protein
MDSKIITLLIIGIVVGSGLGFIGNNLINAPTINTLNERVNGLQTSLNTLNTTFLTLREQYNSLKTRDDKLSSDYNILLTKDNKLSSDYNILLANYGTANLQKTQLETDYNELLTKYQTLLASVPIDTTFTGETTTKTYSWYYKGSSWSLSLNIPDSLYNYYKGLDRAPTRDFSIYVTHPYDDEYLSVIVEKFNYIAITKSLTEAEKVNLVIAFVQSLPYTVDSVTTGFDEYPRYPLETLIDDGGDCEDTAILTAALLHTMNYDVILVSPPGHVAVGVNMPGTYGSYYNWNSKEYFYLETTGEGWTIGQLPNEYKGVSVSVYELKAIPIMTSDWTAKWSGKNIVLTVTVKNVGTAVAIGYKVEAGLDAGNGMWRNVKSSDTFNIAVGNELTITLTLTPTTGYNTRLEICVVNPEGYAIDKSYSTWFDV